MAKLRYCKMQASFRGDTKWAWIPEEKIGKEHSFPEARSMILQFPGESERPFFILERTDLVIESYLLPFIQENTNGQSSTDIEGYDRRD